jgi:hypothetical protein
MESLLLSNSTVAFSTGRFWSLKTVTEIFPFCCALAKEAIKISDINRVNFLMVQTFASKNRRILWMK